MQLPTQDGGAAAPKLQKQGSASNLSKQAAPAGKGHAAAAGSGAAEGRQAAAGGDAQVGPALLSCQRGYMQWKWEKLAGAVLHGTVGGAGLCASNSAHAQPGTKAAAHHAWRHPSGSPMPRCHVLHCTPLPLYAQAKGRSSGSGGRAKVGEDVHATKSTELFAHLPPYRKVTPESIVDKAEAASGGCRV